MANSPQDNNRVTLAVLAVKVDTLSAQIQQLRQELKEDVSFYRAESRERTDDHENRIRNLEGSTRQGLWRDVGAFAAAAAAGVAAVLTGSKP
jgi:hypothetical protein